MIGMFNLSVLTSYSFLVVALGTFFLALSAGMVGCVTVLKGQSLIGDAIGHSSFPGIVLAFMCFQQRNPLILLMGAVISGSVAFMLIQLIHRQGKLSLDCVLAVVLSSFFGLGMVLKSYIQGNPNYRTASQSGLQNYIFGQAAYMMMDDVKLIVLISGLVFLLFVLFYKELKLFVFDEVYANTVGLNGKVMYALIMVCAMSLIGAGLKIVGAILISSLLILPAVTALQWSNRFSKVMTISAVTGGVCSLVGTYLSTVVEGLSTGPAIIVMLSAVALCSLIFAPRGLISTYRARKRWLV